MLGKGTARAQHWQQGRTCQGSPQCICRPQWRETLRPCASQLAAYDSPEQRVWAQAFSAPKKPLPGRGSLTRATIGFNNFESGKSSLNKSSTTHADFEPSVTSRTKSSRDKGISCDRNEIKRDDEQKVPRVLSGMRHISHYKVKRKPLAQEDQVQDLTAVESQLHTASPSRIYFSQPRF
jgi:hypothetical protein